LPIWDKFADFKEFTSFVITSDRLSHSYFLLSCSTEIQNTPKFQNFIQNSNYELPEQCPMSRFFRPIPIARPLQLLYQPSFWQELMDSYFKEVHPLYPYFSIKTFDPKTASQSLISAIYYYGFQFRTNSSEELVSYMDKYAQQNIKKVVKTTEISSVIALIIYSSIIYNKGNLNLSSFCQAHATRICYALGLHISPKRFSANQRYNRSLLFSKVCSMNTSMSRFRSFTPTFMEELGEPDSIIFDPYWQTPDENSVFNFPDKEGNDMYSVCSTELTILNDQTTRIFWTFCNNNFEEWSIESEWNSSIRDATYRFIKCIEAYQTLKTKNHFFELNISHYEHGLKLSYHEFMLEMYQVLKDKRQGLELKHRLKILNHCHLLFKIVVEYPRFNPLAQFYTFLIGFHYLSIFPKCQPSHQKEIIKRLEELINHASSLFLLPSSLNYLILKTGYDLIKTRN
jgi:hypothetical protein